MSAAVPAVAAAENTEVVIRPPERWGGFGFRDVWAYRELLYFLTKRELQIRYKQSFFGGALNVKYRDASVVLPLIVQLWFFATPVIYPATVISPHMQTYLSVNPMFNVINGVRWGFCGTTAPTLLNVSISVATALVFI